MYDITLYSISKTFHSVLKGISAKREKCSNINISNDNLQMRAIQLIIYIKQTQSNLSHLRF